MARFILHIGTHKTATTSIQRFFGQHRAILEARGVYYPGYDLIGKRSHYAHLGMVNALSGQHKSYSTEEARRFFRKVRERAVDYDTTIISGEPFYRHVEGDAPEMPPETYWPARKAYIDRIHDLFGDAEVVVVFRRQADYAQSLYQEHVKVTRYHKRFRDFLTEFWFHFAFLDQVKAWNAAFPVVQAMVFEKLVATGDPVAEFTRLLGLPCAGLPPAERHNEAMSADMVILKRVLQSGPGGKDEHRHRMELLDSRFDPAVLQSVEPRSFFGNAIARRVFQQQFDAANAALKAFIRQDFAAHEPTFPRAFKAETHFGDSLSSRILSEVVDLALSAKAVAPDADADVDAGSDTAPRTPAGIPADGRRPAALALPFVLPAGKAKTGVPGALMQIRVFGDSHAAYFLPSAACGMQRMGFRPRKLMVKGQAIGAASIAGFRPRRSTLQTKEIIRAALPEAEYLCLAFGQVDLELGYYYRKVIRQDAALTKEDFVAWLLELYEQFVLSLDFDRQAMALKGVNLTVLREPAFILRYVSRIVIKDMADPAPYRAALEALIMTESEQNAMSLACNAGLRKICERHGMGYFDLNAALADPGDPASAPRLADCHRPAVFDHHLADTLQVRALHIRALLAVFGAHPADYAV